MRKAKQSNKLLGSGLILALTSSLCCIVPVLAIFSVTGSAMSMLSWVAPLRPYLLAATAIVLGIAFYQAYKPAVKDECGCAEKKIAMQSKTFLWIISVLSIGLSTFPHYSEYFIKAEPNQALVNTKDLNQAVIHITGMSCAACEGHVNQALQQKKGVQQVTTSYVKGQSVVKFDSTQVSLKQLTAAIENETGYKVINLKNTNVK